MSAPYSSATIAKWLIAWAADEATQLTASKLHNLLTYAQVHHIQAFGKPLFDEPIYPVKSGSYVSGTGYELED